MNRIKVQLQRERVNGTIQHKELSIEIVEEGNGINIPATGTITFESALILAKALKKIVANHKWKSQKYLT